MTTRPLTVIADGGDQHRTVDDSTRGALTRHYVSREMTAEQLNMMGNTLEEP